MAFMKFLFYVTKHSKTTCLYYFILFFPLNIHLTDKETEAVDFKL